MIQGTIGIRDAYRDEQVARSYIDERFVEPLGALLHRRQVDLLKQVIGQHRPGRVLEIAPGPARLTTEIAPILQKGMTLVDASAQMLDQARQRLSAVDNRARFVQGDAFNLPFQAEFDLVYAFRLIRHFETPDRLRLYRQIARMLRPAGVMVFDAVNEVVSARVRAKAQPGEHRHYDAVLRRETLAAELRQAGFESKFVGVQHRYSLLTQLQILVAPRSRPLARGAMEIIDRFGGGEPLEWVVICRRE